MIKNRQNFAVKLRLRRFDLRREGNERSGEAWRKKKEREGICQGIETVSRAILRNSNPDFGPERGQGTRSAPCSKRCCVCSPPPPLKLSLPSTPLSSLFLSPSLLRIGPRAQSFTENTECRRSRES